MNKMKQYTKGLLFATLAMTGLSLSSCKDQPDKYEVTGGQPSVNYIRNLSSEVKNTNDAADMHYTNGELVEEASPQTTLCLVGSNLRSVYELYFNDQKAVLNTSYITDNTLIVDVPKSVPHTVTDKIYMVTQDKDTVDFDFHVVIPAPSITTMSCEYAAIGDRVTFTGDYYVNYEDTPLEVFFTDANDNLIPAVINSIANDYTSVDVTIPDGAAEGPVVMTSIYGTSSSVFHYLDSRGMMFDFDNGRIDQGWHGRIISDVNGLKGNYMQLGDGSATMSEAGGWDDSNFSFEYWPGNWDDPQTYPDPQGIRLFDIDGVDLSKPENMSLKFEMWIPSSNAWKAGAMQIIFSPTDYVSLNGKDAADSFGQLAHGANNLFFRCRGLSDFNWDEDVYFKDKEPLPRALYRPWTTTGSYDTSGKWETVTIPIASSFVYNFDGSGATFNLQEKDFAGLTMFIVSGGVKGEECQPIIRIDNIRVIPNK